MMGYCSNCGHKVDDGAKFCSKCGAAINRTYDYTPQAQRKTEYDGVIHKCPNCGEILNAFVSKCPTCGYELRGTAAASAVQELYKNIQCAKNDKEVIRLIKMFPVPNNKEDILELMVLASSNFDEKEYITHKGEDNISAAWLSQIEQCQKKASLSLDSQDKIKANRIYDAIKEKIVDAKKKAHQQYMSQQSEATAKEFRGSKLRIILVIFSVISVLCCAFAFQGGKIFAGIVSALMVVLFLTAFLMGSGVISEQVKNLHLVPAILAFLLFVPYFSLSTNNDRRVHNSSHYDDYIEDNLQQISWKSFNLGEYLPDFGYNEAEVIRNTDDNLMLNFYGLEMSKYESYLDECKEFGYTIDAKDGGTTYTAYNQAGYYLRLQYWDFDDKELSIDLEDPIASEQIIWPSSDLVKDIPIPKSLVGEVSTESSKAYAVYLVQIEPSYFSEYVSLCMDNGFNVDYSKSDTYFHANNKDGISLSVEYKGFNILMIYIENYDW
ncbi:zinc ribbon domain-containing protein [uncultured Gemmiger sp.]|uniref:zinc ribbon domain-containing protein n=1 Tax=uncultured Gemmiger sp. TaxID=1623490 RepID=UPI0025F249A5|nr:zinc ribbon domain-containing protein [uncultured Gemmiger sp.]